MKRRDIESSSGKDVALTRFGVIDTAVDIENVVALESFSPVIAAPDGVLNLANVVGDWFYAKTSSPLIFCEYNPDANLKAGRWCRGSFVETEYKLNVLTCQQTLLKSFGIFELAGFSVGSVTVTPSFEEYFYFECLRAGRFIRPYFVVIREEADVAPNAIKVKRWSVGNILTRRVSLMDYSEKQRFETEAKLIREMDVVLAGPLALPCFSKVKKRCPVIDQDNGYIYGVSFSIAQMSRSKEMPFAQIEIEYWSQLRQSDDLSPIDPEAMAHSYDRLISAVRDVLERQSIVWSERQITKFEWLSGYASN